STPVASSAARRRSWRPLVSSSSARSAAARAVAIRASSAEPRVGRDVMAAHPFTGSHVATVVGLDARDAVEVLAGAHANALFAGRLQPAGNAHAVDVGL